VEGVLIEPSSSAAPFARPLRVLYADDLRELREVMRQIVQREGHELVAVEDGAAAWELCRANLSAFDVVITDHRMPRMDGLQLVEQLRDAGYSGKVIVFTSEANPRVHDAYCAAGVALILLKPGSPRTLREALRSFCPVPA
jgi:CheY-like chemotaxis protein